MKASRDTSDMIFSVNGTIACRPVSRSTIDSSAQRHDAAEGDQRRVARRRIGRASRQRIDQMAGEQRHEQVGDGRAQQAAGDDQRRGRAVPASGGTRTGSPRVSPRGACLFERSWRHPARLWRTPAPSERTRGRPQGRTQASLKNIVKTLGSLERSGLQARSRLAEDGLRRPTGIRAQSIGRGRAICEYIEIMQILPGSSDNALLINASWVICNMTSVLAREP